MESPQSRTLPNLLDEITTRYPHREAVVWQDDRLTYAEYRSRVRQVAKGLHRLGVRAGDKVALLMGNRTEWLLTDFAVALLGATLVPVSTWSRARELAYVLRHCHATTLITVDRFRSQDFIAMLAERQAVVTGIPAPDAIRPIYVRRPDAELARDRARSGRGPEPGSKHPVPGTSAKQ